MSDRPILACIGHDHALKPGAWPGSGRLIANQQRLAGAHLAGAAVAVVVGVAVAGVAVAVLVPVAVAAGGGAAVGEWQETSGTVLPKGRPLRVTRHARRAGRDFGGGEGPAPRFRIRC